MAGVNVRSVSFLLQILFLTNILSIVSSEECVKKGPCRCEFDNGTYIDLTGGSDKFYVVSTAVKQGDTWKMLMFYFNPCKEIVIDDTTPINQCKENSLCTRDVDMAPSPTNITSNLYTATDSGYMPIAALMDSEFLNTDGLTVINYSKDKVITSTIRLICSSMEPTLMLKSSDQKNLILDFYSPQSCLAGIAYNRHSFGTTLVIVFFVMALVYVILGCCVKYFLMGARGIEIFPNVNFWRELPNLIKDGLLFVQNGFRPPPQSAPGAPVANPNPHSYDSI